MSGSYLTNPRHSELGEPRHLQSGRRAPVAADRPHHAPGPTRPAADQRHRPLAHAGHDRSGALANAAGAAAEMADRESVLR